MKTSNGRREFLGAMVSSVLFSSCGGGGAGRAGGAVEDGAAKPQPITNVSVPSLNSLTSQTFYIAHRGSAALYPEETYVAYDSSLSFNQTVLECDVQKLKDGSLALMHDATVDRTTNGSGKTADLTQEQLANLAVDGDIWHGSNYGNQPVPLFRDWVERYKAKSILMPEDKDFLSMSSMLRVLDEARVSKQHVLLQSFNLDSVRAAAAAGYEACFVQMGLLEPSLLNGTGIKWAGIASTALDSQFKAWVASGVVVLAFTVNRRYERDNKLALGVKGFFSDDPVYLSAEQPLETRDKFASQTWAPGMLGSVLDIEGTSRGKFFNGGYWGYDFATNGYIGCLQGYLCPIKGKNELRNYQVNLKVKFDAALNKDATRWASVFIGFDDWAFTDSNDAASGYHFVLRKNGTLEIYKKEKGKTAVRAASLAGVNITDGEEVSFSITMSESAVEVARLSIDGAAQYRASVEDRAPKGSYLQLGRSGLACKFRELFVV